MCRIDEQVDDVYVLPSNPNHMLFLGGRLYVFLSTNGSTSTARGADPACGTRLSVDPSDPARMYIGGPGCYRFAYSEDGGVNLVAPDGDERQLRRELRLRRLRLDGDRRRQRGLRLQQHRPRRGLPAARRRPLGDQRLARRGPRLGRASARSAARTARWSSATSSDTIPDIVKPTGTIAGPATAVAGQTVTFTANVTERRRLGHRPRPVSRGRSDSAAAGGGKSVGIAFPQSGYYTIRVDFRDRAGNTAQATTDIRVTDPPPRRHRPDGHDQRPGVRRRRPERHVHRERQRQRSGIDPARFAWSRDFSGAGRGTSVTMTFPAPGTDTVSVSFADRAGNRNTASVTVPVAPKPEDRPKPVTVNTPAPVDQEAGRPLRDPDQGRLPPAQERGAQARLHGRDRVHDEEGQAARLRAHARSSTRACRYSKSFSVAKSKVGAAKTLGITIRFAGNAWLAPVKKTYQVKVPRLAAVRSQGLLQPGRGVARKDVVPQPQESTHADTSCGGGNRCRPRRRGAGHHQRPRLLASRGPPDHARPRRRQHGRVRVRGAGRAAAS